MNLEGQKAKPSSKVDITPRDLELINALNHCGVISRPLIQLLLRWPCISDVNRRLLKLVRARYLDHRKSRSIDSPAIYTIGPEAVRLLNEKYNIDLNTLNRRRYRYNNIGESLLAHELAITAFACAFRVAMKAIPGGILSTWIPADELIGRCNVTNAAGDQALRPDAYCSYRFGNLEFNLFLEADLGTEPLSRIKQKIELYTAFKASNLFKERFGASAFRVLIITISTKRVINAAAALAKFCNIKIFIANLNHHDENLLSAPIWLKSGQNEFCGLHSQVELEGRKE